MAYRAYLTPAALAANLASAAPGGDAVELASIAIGDAGGVAYEPDGSESDLVNEVAEAAIASVEIDPANPLQLLVSAVFTADIGGFVVREAAVRFEDGSLYAIANVPPTTKPDPDTDGAAVEMLITLVVAYDGAADVQVNVDPSIVYATQEWVWSHRHFFAVHSATTTAPPGGPAVGDHYLVPAGATGAWAGQADKVAIWRNLTDGWLFVSPPDGAQAQPADSALSYRKASEAWAPGRTSPASKLYLHSTFR